jgi:hypothetical protein
MKGKAVLAVTAISAISAIFVPGASANVGDKVTGGGQVFFSTDQNDTKQQGPLSTIGFNAQQTSTAVKGQVQFIDRSGGKGRDQVKFHGIVDCVNVMGNQALIGGYQRDATGKRFSMYVEDNGEGANAMGADVITFNYKDADPDCSFQNDDNDVKIQLARGNVQVHGSSPTDQGFQDQPMMAAPARTLLGL